MTIGYSRTDVKPREKATTAPKGKFQTYQEKAETAAERLFPAKLLARIALLERRVAALEEDKVSW